MIRKPAAILFVLSVAALALVLIPVAGLAARGGNGGAGAGGTSRSGCSISPGQVVLDQDWTVSAWGLPTNSTVNRRIVFPDGTTSTGPVTVASGGTYTTTGNSNMSAGWGFVAPEQKGTYTYLFVNRIKWPAGTYTKLYGTCSVVVS